LKHRTEPEPPIVNITLTPERIGALAQTMGISAADLAAIISRGASHSYKAGDYLYHESTPRLWMGIVEEGEIEIVRGLHGSSVRLATLTPGTGFSEGVMLEDLPHSGSAVALTPARVWQIPRAVIDEIRVAKPELFYRMAGHVARRLSARLRAAGEQLSGGAAPIVATWRMEHDLLGERELPDTAYYGVQTLRGMENFPLSGIPLRHFQHFVRALAFVKKAAASANSELGVLDRERAEAIAAACEEIIAGKLHEHFTVDMIQGGAGTSTNMNANEVIANRALELLGHRKGEYQYLHPNDYVNCSQSTDDVYPTAVKLGVCSLSGIPSLLCASSRLASKLNSGIETADSADFTDFEEVIGSERTNLFVAKLLGIDNRSLLHPCNLHCKGSGSCFFSKIFMRLFG
jgi:aspartate ammonia-lyase